MTFVTSMYSEKQNLISKCVKVYEESSELEDCGRILTLRCNTVLKGVTDAMLECDAGPTNVTMCLTVGEFQIGQKSQVHIEHVSAKTTFKKYGSKAMIFCPL